MLAKAKYFRSHGVPIGIRKYFALHKSEIDRSAIIWARSDRYILGYGFGLEGMLVTVERRFFRFELDMDALQEEVISVHEFVEVTAQRNDSEHNRGTGKGEGALAVAVLEAMNSV